MFQITPSMMVSLADRRPLGKPGRTPKRLDWAATSDLAKGENPVQSRPSKGDSRLRLVFRKKSSKKFRSVESRRLGRDESEGSPRRPTT